MLATSTARSGITRHHILAADDDPIMREMMMARLGDDLDVTCAENGEVAWEKLLKDHFDLAIIDLTMPKLDGFGLIRYLRQTPKTVDLPIIVATSRGDQNAIEQAFACGASGFVTKPVNWSLFKYNVQFALKNGLAERQLRASKQASELIIRTKDNLLNLLSTALESLHSTTVPNPSQSNVSDAIYLSRLLSSGKAANFNQSDVNEIVAQAVKDCRFTAADKSVKLIARRTMANISINVDKSLWLNALTRLILLGIKSAPAGGTVEVIPGEQADGSLVLSIRDNGAIKRPSEIESAMNILADEISATPYSNSIPDLNLPIVKYSVEMHNGRALFHNLTGSGNIAALWLPAARVDIEQLEKFA